MIPTADSPQTVLDSAEDSRQRRQVSDPATMASSPAPRRSPAVPQGMRPPRTILEWVRLIRYRRLEAMGSEEQFAEHMRHLHDIVPVEEGWERAALEAALAKVKGERILTPIEITWATKAEEPTAKAASKPAAETAPPPRQRLRRRRRPSVLPAAFLHAEAAAPDGRQCTDCGDPLPSDRRRPGRCDQCRKKRRRASWRAEKRRQRNCPVGVSYS